MPVCWSSPVPDSPMTFHCHVSALEPVTAVFPDLATWSISQLLYGMSCRLGLSRACHDETEVFHFGAKNIMKPHAFVTESVALRCHYCG